MIVFLFSFILALLRVNQILRFTFESSLSKGKSYAADLNAVYY